MWNSCERLQEFLFPVIGVCAVPVWFKLHFPDLPLWYDYRLDLDRRGICVRCGSLQVKFSEGCHGQTQWAGCRLRAAPPRSRCSVSRSSQVTSSMSCRLNNNFLTEETEMAATRHHFPQPHWLHLCSPTADAGWTWRLRLMTSQILQLPPESSLPKHSTTAWSLFPTQNPLSLTHSDSISLTELTSQLSSVH